MLRYLLLAMCVFLACCGQFDFSSADYSEEDTLALLINSPYDSIKKEVFAIDIYVLAGDGFFSEKWLASHSITRLQLNNSLVISSIIEELRYNDDVESKKNFIPKPLEYHIIFKLFSGKKVYVRLLEEDNAGSTYKIVPYAPMVYQINRPEKLYEQIKHHKSTSRNK